MRRLSVAVLFLALTTAALVRAGEEAPEPKISSWVAAPEGESLADLRGRAVLLVPLDPEDVKRVHLLNDLRAAFWAKGLRIVGLLEKAPASSTKGVETSIAVGSLAGDGAVLVGPDGTVAWEGDAKDLGDQVVADALRRSKNLFLRPVCPALKPAAAAFTKGQLEKAREIAELAGVAEGSTDEATADGDYVVGRVASLLGYWQRQAERATAARDYPEATACLDLIVKRFPDTDEAAAAAGKLKALRADPAAKKEVLAAATYIRLRTDLLRAAGKETKIVRVVKNLDRFVEKSGGTKGAERAARLLDAIRVDRAIAAVREFISQEKIKTTSSNWKKSLPKPPRVAFSEGKTYFWNLETSHGSIRLRFFPDVAPMHVSSTIYLTELGFYDGIVFHRVITNFMAQGGCPDGTGTGGPGYQYNGEFDQGTKHDRAGILSMANAGVGTDGSQFFITFKATPHLDGKHTVFGVLVEGMDTLRKLEKLGSSGGATSERIEIRKATITTE